jgi:IS5 family transposase
MVAITAIPELLLLQAVRSKYLPTMHQHCRVEEDAKVVSALKDAHKDAEQLVAAAGAAAAKRAEEQLEESRAALAAAEDTSRTSQAELARVKAELVSSSCLHVFPPWPLLACMPMTYLFQKDMQTNQVCKEM